MLKTHPQVFMCEPKEPQFFSRPDCFSRGLPWYENLFAGSGNAIAVGEASANYSNSLFAETASRRISQFLPDARLVYCVRHPLRRVESAWIHVRSRDYTREDRACGIEPVPADMARAFRCSTVGRDVLETSLYWRQLNFFRRFFPDERIHICFFEDFCREPQATIQECLRFLAVDSAVNWQNPALHLNSSSHKREPTRMYEAIKRLPGLSRLACFVPDAWKWQPAQKPVGDKGTYAWVCRLLQEDAGLFLKHCGRPVSFWDFAAPTAGFG
jgi:hypothetical protein